MSNMYNINSTSLLSVYYFFYFVSYVDSFHNIYKRIFLFFRFNRIINIRKIKMFAKKKPVMRRVRQVGHKSANAMMTRKDIGCGIVDCTLCK